MPGQRSRGLPKCKARSKRTGQPCLNRVVQGHAVCRMHGAGCPSRVRAGKRKPPGRPLVTGQFSDPERTRYGRLGELLEQFRDDSALLSQIDQIALAKAVLQWQFERMLAGDWDVMKSENLPEHPATWIIEQCGKVQAMTYRAAVATFKDEIRAAVELLRPACKVIENAVNQFVPTEQQQACLEFIRAGMSKIVVPVV